MINNIDKKYYFLHDYVIIDLTDIDTDIYVKESVGSDEIKDNVKLPACLEKGLDESRQMYLEIGGPRYVNKGINSR